MIKLAEEKDNIKIKCREELYVKNVGNINITCHIDGNAYRKIDTADIFGIFSHIHEGKTTNFRAFYSNKSEITDSLDEDGNLSRDFNIKRKWGEPGSDEVPEEYQVQSAVQRICTGAELVKLSVLVFPRTQQEFEDEGWLISKMTEPESLAGKPVIYKPDDLENWVCPDTWAKVFSDIGNFHTYNLPSHPELESEIIATVQKFHSDHVLTELPPAAEKYDDIRRLLTKPQGIIICTDPELKRMCSEYSEITRQLGSAGPMKIRKEALKIAITQYMKDNPRDDWADPPDKIVVLDPNGGDVLASYSNSGFRTKRAR